MATDDHNDYNVIVDETGQFSQLEESICALETDLKQLRDSVFVSHFENILPCLEEQVRVYNKLTDFKNKYTDDKHKLTKAVNHAKGRLDQLTNSLNAGFHTYKHRKADLLTEIGTFTDHEKEMKRKTMHLNNIMFKVREAVQGLESVTKLVRDPNEREDFHADKSIIFEKSQYVEVQRLAINAIKAIKPRLENLVSGYAAAQVERLSSAMHMNFARFKQLRSINVFHTAMKLEDFGFEDDMDEMYVEDSSVPNNNDIKQESRQIVEEHKAAEIV